MFFHLLHLRLIHSLALLLNRIRFGVSSGFNHPPSHAGVTTRWEWSDNLATWAQTPPTGLVTTRNGELMRLEFPASGSSVFFRVRAMMP